MTFFHYVHDTISKHKFKSGDSSKKFTNEKSIIINALQECTAVEVEVEVYEKKVMTIPWTVSGDTDLWYIHLFSLFP